jgi:hypothetical protein
MMMPLQLWLTKFRRPLKTTKLRRRRRRRTTTTTRANKKSQQKPSEEEAWLPFPKPGGLL